MQKAGDRPELRALAAEAQADVRLGNAFRWPALAPAFSYKRDQGDRVVQCGLTFTLPLFNRGQELQAVGQARTRRVERELEATKRAAFVEVRTAFTMIAASTRRPTAIARPPSVIVLMPIPRGFNSSPDSAINSGSVRVTISAARRSPRRTKSTMMTRTAPSRMARSTPPRELRMSSDWS